MPDHEWEGGRGHGPRVVGPPREVIEALPELNAYCLRILAAQARTGRANKNVTRIAELWLGLDPPARRRAADYPFLLFDVGFSDPQRWQNLDRACVTDMTADPYGAVFAGPEAVVATQLVLVYAWSLARRYSIQARLLLGMHPTCAEWIAARSVFGAHQLAERLWVWLQPRWLHTPEFWEELMRGAAQGGLPHLCARLQGMRLLASETAAALQRSGHDEVP